GIEAERYQSLLQNNCAISVLNFKGGFEDPVQLESMNLTAHLAGLEGATPIPEMKSGDRGPQLVLVRHGETEWNRKGQFQGQIDIPLNENGLAQAAKAASFLKDVTLDMAFSSSLSRPKETAEAILKNHPPMELTLIDGMKEISHGLWEGKFEADIEAGYPGLLEQWQAKPETVQMPEGENLQDVWDRVAVSWRQIVETVAAQQEVAGRSLRGLVAAHDAVNKALLCQVTGLGPENFWNFKQGNGGVSVIGYPHGIDGLPMLQTMNITHHLSGEILDKTAAGAL
ncbi:MAG: histidine phosphatase family protein, partial [Cyanobacteria bacterium P01_H01_bin.130]